MKYFSVQAEVAGGLGPHTVMDPNAHPPVVHHLHFEFEGWAGDALVQTFPCFLVTRAVQQGIMAAGATGVAFAPAEVSKSEQFELFHPEVALPEFLWLKVRGAACVDDFGLMGGIRLVVSERMLSLLRENGLTHALVLQI